MAAFFKCSQQLFPSGMLGMPLEELLFQIKILFFCATVPFRNTFLRVGISLGNVGREKRMETRGSSRSFSGGSLTLRPVFTVVPV